MTPNKIKERPAKYWVVERDSRIELVPGYWPPAKHIGKFVRDVDGFYYYWPQVINQALVVVCFTGWLLIAVGEELEKLNKAWGDKLSRELVIKRIKKRK